MQQNNKVSHKLNSLVIISKNRYRIELSPSLPINFKLRKSNEMVAYNQNEEVVVPYTLASFDYFSVMPTELNNDHIIECVKLDEHTNVTDKSEALSVLKDILRDVNQIRYLMIVGTDAKVETYRLTKQ